MRRVVKIRPPHRVSTRPASHALRRWPPRSQPAEFHKMLHEPRLSHPTDQVLNPMKSKRYAAKNVQYVYSLLLITETEPWLPSA